MTVTGLPDPATPPTTPRRPAPGELTLAAPRRALPPRHLADLEPAERSRAAEELGHRGFRAGQLSRHYFGRLVDDPAEMTDLPAGARDELVEALLPRLLTPVRHLVADEGRTVKSVWRLHDGALPAGRHLLHWDRRDAGGTSVRPGLYLVQATVGGWKSTRRIVVR